MEQILKSLENGSPQVILAIAVVGLTYAILRGIKYLAAKAEDYHQSQLSLVEKVTSVVQKNNDSLDTNNRLLIEIKDELLSRPCLLPQGIVEKVRLELAKHESERRG